MKRNLPSYFGSALRRSALLGFLFLGLNNMSALAAPAGYDYRTINSGSWHSMATWERTPTGGSSWLAVSDINDIPDATAGTITIDHEVSINSPITADEIAFTNSGLFDLFSTLTLPNSGSGDINMNGGAIYVNPGGALVTNANKVLGSGEFVLFDGGTLYIGSPDGIYETAALGNIQVSGFRSFSTDATYIYNGTTAQITGDGIPTGAQNLVINNPNGLTLSKSLSLTQGLTLTEGKIKTAGYNLTLNSSASITPPAANKVSFVEGALTVKAGTPRVIQFPIGKGNNYRPVTLTIVSTSGENTYTAEQFDQAFAVPGGTTIPEQVDKISGIRYFTITESSGYAVTANLTLNYGSDDNVTDAAKLAVVKYGASGWEYLGGSGASNGTGAITTGNFTTFSSFMLANQTGGQNPLPVELISFSAKAAEKDVQLNWITASEVNSDRFEIERSFNGKAFEKVGSLKTGNNSNAEKRYTFTDKNPGTGNVYYRLKQVDLDGSISYSAVEMVSFESKFAAPVIYPNPVASALYIKANSGKINKVRILNMVGQEVYSQSVPGLEQTTMQVDFLPAGSYQVMLEGLGKLSVLKFIKTSK